jgi:D-alanyl-D-alanine carboxypeptidase (penicillin-binding protein 5/6)
MRLISVVLGSPSIRAREDASAALLNYGYTFFETVKLFEANKAVLTPEVFKGAAESVAVGSRKPISVTIARGQADQITKEAKVDTPLIAPIEAGAPLGTYTVRVGDEVVARVPLVALQKVESGGLWTLAVDSIKLWFQ